MQSPAPNTETIEYWGVIVFAAAITLAALVFLYLSRTTPTYSGALVNSYDSTLDDDDDFSDYAGAFVSDAAFGHSAAQGQQSLCDAPMELTSKGRLVVTVDGNHRFVVDTAYDFNGVDAAVDQQWKREGRVELEPSGQKTVTVMTSKPTQMRWTSLPAGMSLGAGNDACTVPLRTTSKTIVLNAGTLGPREQLSGILGRAVLESPAFSSMTLEIPHSPGGNGRIRFNAPPPRGAPLLTTTSRDPHFNLFVVPITLFDASGSQRLTDANTRFVVDTGASRLVIEQNLARRILQQHPELSLMAQSTTMNMSGSLSKTLVKSNMVCVMAGARRRTSVSFVTDGASPETVLNRTDGVAGLLGTNCLRGMTLYIDNRGGGSMTFYNRAQ